MARLGSGISLVARTAEVRTLRAALADAERGAPSVVLVSGDAGVGKTRLLGELGKVADHAGALVLAGRCLDLADGGLPYLPFAEALGSLTSSTTEGVAAAVAARPALARMLPQLAAGRASAERADAGADSGLLGGLETARHEQDVGQLQLFDAVLGLLGELSESHVTVLVIEDLHWADSSSRALLSFLASRLRGHRLVLAASYRTEDVNRGHPLRALLAELLRLETVQRVELAPLRPAQARKLVAELSERVLDGQAQARIAERGEGNPFFTEELVAASMSDGETAELPSGLAEVLLARVESLARAAKQVVRTLSVADGAATHGALADVTELGEAELDDALRAAVLDHVLVVDGQYYGFRHALLREAVYGDLMPGERTRLHARYAASLRGREDHRGDSALLAYHSRQSNDLPTALLASVRAAEEAGEWGGAPAAALRHTEHALRVWDAVPRQQRPPETDELLLLYRAANYASKSGQPERAIAYARSATEALRDADSDRAARVWRRLAKALSFQDDTEAEAAAAIERAWGLVTDDAPSVARARVLATRAEVLRSTGARAEAAWSAGAAVADATAAGAPDAATDALITTAVLAEREGDVVDSREKLREAIRQAGESGVVQEELRAWHFLGLSYDDEGELAKALEVYREGLDRAASTGLTWSVWGTELHTRAAVLTHTIGEWPRDGDDVTWRGESGAVTARAGSGRVQTAVAQGRFDDADRLLAGMRPHWRTEIRIAISYASAGAELAFWRGEYPRALRCVREAVELLEQFDHAQLGGLRLAALGVQACAAMVETEHGKEAAGGDPLSAGNELLEHARECATHGRPHAGTLGPEGRAWLARAEATASGLQGRADPSLWADAVAAFGYGAVYEQAVCRWYYARALLATGERAAAAGHAAEALRQAHEAAQRLRAEPLADAVRILARRSGLELPGEPSRGPAATPLTARESAVLEQVAGGTTNRQAGERLYISEKTVSVHLSRLMAKLGATSRAEAVAIAYDRGLLAHLHETTR